MVPVAVPAAPVPMAATRLPSGLRPIMPAIIRRVDQQPQHQQQQQQQQQQPRSQTLPPIRGGTATMINPTTPVRATLPPNPLLQVRDPVRLNVVTATQGASGIQLVPQAWIQWSSLFNLYYD